MNWKMTECVLALITAIVIVEVCNTTSLADKWYESTLLFFEILLFLIFIAMAIKAIYDRYTEDRRQKMVIENEKMEELRGSLQKETNLRQKQEQDIKDLKEKITHLNDTIADQKNEIAQNNARIRLFYYFLQLSENKSDKASSPTKDADEVMKNFESFLHDFK